MPKPSQIFLMETTPGFWLFSFSILYTVEGGIPDAVANALTAISYSAHNSWMRFATASFVFKITPPYDLS